jgi:hypothetical protein
VKQDRNVVLTRRAGEWSWEAEPLLPQENDEDSPSREIWTSEWVGETVPYTATAPPVNVNETKAPSVVEKLFIFIRRVKNGEKFE